jgi:hypothetical protein
VVPTHRCQSLYPLALETYRTLSLSPLSSTGNLLLAC